MNRAQNPRIGFVANSLAPGLGGIPRVARLIQRSLESLADSGRLTFQCLTLDKFQAGKSRLGLSIAALRMLVAQRRMALSCTHFLYDSCQMAQVHGRPWLLSAPALTFIHGIEVWEHAKPRWITACRNSRVLASNSEFTRRRAHQLHGDFERTRVSWLATESQQPLDSVPNAKPPTVLIVSRVDKQEGYKGHVELIDAWPEVSRAVPEARLRIVGRGSGLAELKQRAAILPCKDNIVFDGFVAEEQLDDIYRSSTVFAMPSRGEGFGIVYIEAMRCGLPVITSRQDAGQEVIIDGQTGYAVDLDNPLELPRRIIQLLTNPTLARQMGLAGQARWQQHFTPSQFVNRFSPIILQLLAEKSGRSR